MKKFITPTYTFTPGISGVGTVNLSGITGFDVKYLVAIINQTDGIVIYSTGSQTLKYTNVTGTTITLLADTSSMSAGDTLQVIYEDNSAIAVEAVLLDKDGNEVSPVATVGNGAAVGNSLLSINESFAIPLSALEWDEQWINQGSSTSSVSGESLGSTFLKISMCPYTQNSEYVLTSKKTFKLPSLLKMGFSASHRALGTEFEVGIAAVDINGDIEYISAKPDVTLPSTIAVSANVATITFTTAHPFVGGDRVILANNQNNRLNQGPVQVTVVDNFTITVPLTAADNPSWPSNGVVRFVDILKDAKNSAGLIIGDNVNVTNATLATRANGSSVKSENLFIATTAAQIDITSNFSENFRCLNNLELRISPEDLTLISSEAGDFTSNPSTTKFTEALPDSSKNYKIIVRTRTTNRMSRPIAKIVSASKAGTTTATIVTDVPHGLSTASRITVTGIENTNFPNLVATVNPLSIINSTSFTVNVGGATVTATSSGGRVDLCQGNTLVIGGSFPKVQNISRTNNLMDITFLSSPTGLNQGETIHLYGCTAGSLGLYDGAYMIRRVNNTVVTVESVGADIPSTSCGGSILERTDFRLHNLKLNEYLKTTVDLDTTLGSLDLSKAINIRGTIGVSDIGTPVQVSQNGTWVIDSITNTVTVQDATTNVFPETCQSGSAIAGTNILTPFFKGRSGFMRFFLDITAFTGTNRAKFTIQDSYGFSLFKDLYTFESFAGIGTLVSPIISTTSSEFRIIAVLQTGVSVSYTLRNQIFSVGDTQNVAQQTLLSTVDINLNNVGAFGPSLRVTDCSKLFLSANVPSQASAATLGIEVSMNGVDWLLLTGSIATTPGVVAFKQENQSWNFARVKVITGGTTVVTKEVILRGIK